jgi:hypothetical protein
MTSSHRESGCSVHVTSSTRIHPVQTGSGARASLRALRLLAVVVVLGAFVASVPIAAGAGRHTPPAIGHALTLPSAKPCLTTRTLIVQLRKIHRVRWVSMSVKINGKPSRTIKGAALRKPIRLKGLPTGRFALKITARTGDRRTVSATRTYRACAAKPKPPVTIAAAPGSYTGQDASQPSFFVSANGKQVQDVQAPTTLACTPGGSLSNHFEASQLNIGPDGSFSSTTTQTGVIDNAAAHFTYTLTGHFSATNVTGTFREDVTYTNGVSYTCTTGTKSWTAARDTQGTETTSPSPPGSYTGRDASQPSFFVSANGSQLQDVQCSDDTGLHPRRLAVRWVHRRLGADRR